MSKIIRPIKEDEDSSSDLDLEEKTPINNNLYLKNFDINNFSTENFNIKLTYQIAQFNVIIPVRQKRCTFEILSKYKKNTIQRSVNLNILGIPRKHKKNKNNENKPENGQINLLKQNLINENNNNNNLNNNLNNNNNNRELPPEEIEKEMKEKQRIENKKRIELERKRILENTEKIYEERKQIELKYKQKNDENNNKMDVDNNYNNLSIDFELQEEMMKKEKK